MLKVGLTGGIGAGKSEVSRLLVERGAVLVDADRIAREVVAPGTEGLAAVVEAFGPGILAADGSLDRPAHRALLRRLLDTGIRTLTPNGNTGEFHALSPGERRAVTELTVAEAGERATVVVGVGHDLATATADARHAAEAGARLVMVHQPAHPYVSGAGWVAYHRAVAEAVPGLGVVPYVRDPRLPGSRLAELADVARQVTRGGLQPGLGDAHPVVDRPGEAPVEGEAHDRGAAVQHLGDIDLPKEVEGLYELAYNLWWTWNPRASELFSTIDSRACAANPSAASTAREVGAVPVEVEIVPGPGPAVRGTRIDIWNPSTEWCRSFGVQTRAVWMG